MKTQPWNIRWISNLFRKNGIEISRSWSTRIRGWSHWNEGIVIDRVYQDSSVDYGEHGNTYYSLYRIQIRWRPYSSGKYDEIRKLNQETEAVRVLTNAGIKIEQGENGWILEGSEHTRSERQANGPRGWRKIWSRTSTGNHLKKENV